MGSTLRGVTPHATKGNGFVQPGTDYKTQGHVSTTGLYQQPGNPVPMGQQSPVISKERPNG